MNDPLDNQLELLIEETKDEIFSKNKKKMKNKKNKKNKKISENDKFFENNKIQKRVTRCSRRFSTELMYRFWFESLNFYRNPTILATILILFLFLCSIVGWFFRADQNTFESAQNRVGLTLFFVLLVAFQSLFSIPTFFYEKPVYIFQIQLSVYYKSAYFYSKIIFEAFITKIIPIFFLLPCYFIAQMTGSFMNIFYFLLIMITFNICLGLNNFIFCCIFQKPEVTIIMMVTMHLFGILASGAFLNINAVPPALRFIRFFSYWNYAFKALIYNEVNDKYFYVGKGLIPGFEGYVPGTILLKKFGVMPENFQNYVKFLLLFVIILFFASKRAFKRFINTKN